MCMHASYFGHRDDVTRLKIQFVFVSRVEYMDGNLHSITPNQNGVYACACACARLLVDVDDIHM